MGGETDTKFTGLQELSTFLEQLPDKLEKNVIRGGLRKGMKLPQAEARAKLESLGSVKTGLLAKGLSIRTKATKQGMVTVRLVSLGPHGYIAKWLEYGTAPHEILAAKNAEGKFAKGLAFSGLVRDVVHHPGIAPNKFPFMRVALDKEANQMVVTAAEYIKNRIETKGGLDMPDLEFGVDSSGSDQ